MKKTDILVIGTGLAGAISAIIAADNNKKVTIITKTDDIISGSTAAAQGGIIYRGIDDASEKLINDIMLAGAGHCWEPAVSQLAIWGPKLVVELLINRFKINFDKSENNDFDLTAEGAHSIRRIIHSKDLTGRDRKSVV